MIVIDLAKLVAVASLAAFFAYHYFKAIGGT